MGDEHQVDATPQPKHKKSSFSTHADPPNTERAEKISVPQAPVANNFVLEEASGDSQSKTSAQFPDFELKEKQVNQKSAFSGAHITSMSDGEGEEETKVINLTEEPEKQQPVIYDSIKEVDESETQDAVVNKVTQDSEIDQSYILAQVNKIWDKYDVDYSGVLDKIESANFLNEILRAQGKGPPTMEEFNRFFAEFDINHDGVI